MDATSSNFAVSSLCAATASCGAASLGYAWATTKESSNANKSNLLTPNTFSSTLRQTSSVRRPKVQKPLLQRPKSAIIIGSRDNPWALSPNIAAGTRTSHQSVTPVDSLQEVEEPEGTPAATQAVQPRRRRSTWFRRRFTLNSSSDHDSAVTDQPSTPSTYTHASNTPFLPTSAPLVTSRNRLVKRSTSQSFRTSIDTDSAPLFRPTFRRPATSHQRTAAELHGHALRHRRSQSSAAPSLTPSVQPGRETSELSRKQSNQWHWEPFFKRHIARVRAPIDSALKHQGSALFGNKDELRCIRGPSGELPTLVMAASITAQISVEHNFATPQHLKDIHAYQAYSEPVTTNQARRMSQFREEFPESVPPTTEQDGRISSTFLFNNLLPSPSPAGPFKIIRRRSTKKNDSQTTHIGMRRNVSDTHVQPASQISGSSGGGSVLVDSPNTETANKQHHITDRQLAHARSVSNIGATYLTPGIRREDISQDQLARPDTRESGERGHHNSFSGGLERASSTLSTSNVSSSGARFSRGSRVVSDHGSTLVGSDTDASRVFSVNGDDTDGFSETNYDSIRTGGTNSSHSAVRSTRIENVFDEPGRDLFTGDSLSVLEEKLSEASLSSSSKLGAPDAGNDLNLHSLRTSSYLTDSPVTFAAQPNTVSSSLVPNGPSSPSISQLAGNPLTVPEHDDEELDALWEMSDEERDLPISKLDLGTSAVHPLQGLPAAQPAPASDPTKVSQLWKWSEKSQDDVARPQTVHGKAPAERKDRSTSRRPNGHARSQSVPNVTDNNKARFNDSAKLDAWTLGGKGASDDWDEDFALEEADDESETQGRASARTSKEFRSSGFVVPSTILEKQSSVHGQFSHVKELTLLVEELRRLRRRAHELGIRNGQASSLWVEAEGIIDLATLDEEGELAPPVAPRPSSPTSTENEFEGRDEKLSTPPSIRQSLSIAREDAIGRGSPAQQLRSNDVSRASPASTPRSMSYGASILSSTPPVGRPRTDSTAQAKTVLDHIHHHRTDKTSMASGTSEPMAILSPSENQVHVHKQPFDTQSLKDLVIRAGVVTRALKEIIRQAEEPLELALPETPEPQRRRGSGLGIANTDMRDPPFSQIFQHPGPVSTPPSQRRSPLFKREQGQGTPRAGGAGGELEYATPIGMGKGKEIVVLEGTIEEKEMKQI